jgi:hypothetical protein
MNLSLRQIFDEEAATLPERASAEDVRAILRRLHAHVCDALVASCAEAVAGARQAQQQEDERKTGERVLYPMAFGMLRGLLSWFTGRPPIEFAAATTDRLPGDDGDSPPSSSEIDPPEVR